MAQLDDKVTAQKSIFKAITRGEHKSLQIDREILIPGPDTEVQTVNQIYDRFINENIWPGSQIKAIGFTRASAANRFELSRVIQPFLATLLPTQSGTPRRQLAST